MKVATTAPRSPGESALMSPDSRGRISLGKDADDLYAVTRTTQGYILEKLDVEPAKTYPLSSEELNALEHNKEFIAKLENSYNHMIEGQKED